MSGTENLGVSELSHFVKSGDHTTTGVRAVNVGGFLIALPVTQISPYTAPIATDQTIALFADDQLLTDPLGFGSVSGTVTLGLDGAFIENGGLTGGGFKFGTQYHWEEGIFRLDAPLGNVCLGYHDADYPAGQLWINSNSGDYRFEFWQANDGGDTLQTYTFDTPEPAVGTVSSGGLPEYNYYRFLRAGTSATLDLVNSSGIQTQTLTLTDIPLPVAGTGSGNHYLGNPALVDRAISMLWFRSTYSDSTSIPTARGGEAWTGAEVYENPTIVVSSGDRPLTWMDSGAAGSYWSFLRALSVDSFLGSSVRVRMVATDTVPAGSLDSEFAAATWYDLTSNAPIELPGGGEQGRYLVLKLEFTPAAVSLNGAASDIRQNVAAGAALLADWQATAWPTPPVPDGPPTPITLSGEGASEGTIPVLPDIGTETTFRAGTVRSQFEGPYAATVSTTTRSRRNWVVKWGALTGAEQESLLTFFGNVSVFDWTDPNGDAANASLVGGSVRASQLAPDIYTVSAEFVERFS